MTFARRFTILLLAVSVASQAQQQQRPRVGVALGGGGALGLAHVGVLLWMERNHIPVDTIAGTSMGALIAGSYATGMSAGEVEILIERIDWHAAFRGTAPYGDLRFRRKEDKRTFPNRFELGIKHGVQTPSGLTSGFGLTLLLDRIFIGIPTNQSFDQLSTPFRCIATDLVTGNRVELKDGPLAEALRASSAIPGLFEPVRRKGQVLVDGGIVDNLPVDSARDLGADIVIASVLPVAALKPEEIQGFGVLSRSVSVAVVQNERQSARKAEILIEPEVATFSTTDYAEHDALIRKGIEAAELKKDLLLRYALNDADWADFLRTRQGKRKTAVPAFQGVDVSGGSHLSRLRVDVAMKKLIERSEDPGPVDPKQIEAVLFQEYGTGRYISAGYAGRLDPDGARILEVNLADKLHGPPFAYVNPEIRGEDSGRTDLTIHSRFVFLEFGGQNAELRADLSIGSHTLAGVEYYRRIGLQGWFWAPRASFDRRQSSYYVADRRVGDFDIRQAGVGVDVGYTARLDNEVRAGFEYGRIGATAQTGVVPLANQDGVLKAFKLQFGHDGQDSEQVPSRGLRFTGTGRYYFSAPVSSGFPLLRFDSSWFHTVSTRDRLFVLASGGSSFGHRLAVPLQFTLGGPLRLSAFGRDEFRGDRVGYASLGWLRRIGKLPPVLGGSVFLGGWYEAGGFSLPGQQTWRQNGTIAFVAETPLGPFYTGWSLGHATDRWKGKFTFLVGRFF